MCMSCNRKMSTDSQVEAWKADLLSDAAHAEGQAKNGPLYPDKGITRESLLAYAAQCRADASRAKETLKAALKHF